MISVKLFNGSKLTARFFAIFFAFSLLTIVFIIIIASVIIFIKAPAFNDRHNSPPHEMSENHHFDNPDERFEKPHFDHRPPKRPGPPPGLINDLIAALSIFAFLAVVFSFLVAHYLSRYFLLPVSELANATKKFSNHDFSTRIPVNRKDEIGMLAHDFNEMADRLQKYEEMRKQWIADIAHELRTPISIMQAEVEAVQDAVWPLDMNTMNRLHSEILYIAKTVNDLHLLSVAESEGLSLNMEPVSIAGFLTDASNRFSEKLKTAGINLEMEFSSEKNTLGMADPYFLRTVFNNLIENSIRYTDMPGKLKISCFEEASDIVVIFEDSAPGVPEEYINRIFDRLFRVDSSRSRKHGGSGLGLSTCRTHIEAMNGTITASSSPLGGLKITIRIPLLKKESAC